jgi:phosphoserine aminotransferase
MIHNFSAGPAILPKEVLQKASEACIDFNNSGLSLLEVSHRGKDVIAVFDKASSLVKKLLKLNDDYAVIFVQGGASTQFAMVPHNFLGKKAAYLNTGVWASRAVKEAKHYGETTVVASSEDKNFSYIPKGFVIPTDADYFHYTSNNTIYGTQLREVPSTGVPLICDMSSDFLSKPIDCERYAMIYAHAQKNLGPAGVTVVVMHESLLDRCRRRDVPAMLSFHRHVEAGSVYNTPPVFAIYVLGLVLRWMLDSIGGLEQMDRVNTRKATCIYDVLDKDRDFWEVHAHPKFRSAMNIAFRLRSPQLESTFLQEAEQVGFRGLEGHRTLGGLRISLYNGVEYSSACRLATFMEEFSNRYRNKGDAG